MLLSQHNSTQQRKGGVAITVKELREQLDRFPDEMEVWLTDDFYGKPSTDILTVETVVRQQWTPTEIKAYSVVVLK